MADIPQEITEVMDGKELRENVAQQPGSLRFKAMVLGLSALQYLKEQEKGESETDKDSQ